MAKQKKRKWWYRGLKKIMKCRYKKPEFVFLGEKLGESGIIVANHDGTDSPMSLEIYLDAPLKFWGTWQMNSGFSKMYKYQTRVFYHEKKRWNLHLARLFCLLATPLTYLFYKGLDLISTYSDVRIIKTINESVKCLKEGDNIVIFPEDSTDGYLKEMKGFHGGFALLAEVAYKNGVDTPIYPAYYRKEDKVYAFGNPVRYSELKDRGLTRDEICQEFCTLCNELGKMDLDSVKNR